MANQTQIDRLKRVRNFIESNVKKELTASDIADVACYSYRNINRIFQAVYQESIGAFYRRLKVEALAKLVLYTDKSITEIAFEAGFSDLQAFNKTFKKLFDCTPLQFRTWNQQQYDEWLNNEALDMEANMDALSYRIETLPDVRVLYLPYHGPYEVEPILQHWDVLTEFVDKHNIFNERSQIIGEILDDEDITQPERCRYNCTISLTEELKVDALGFMEIKIIPEQKYAIFTYEGTDQGIQQTYDWIYGKWILEERVELIDKPILERYLNRMQGAPKDEYITEICIPIQ
ncbi:MAG: GyrI-like domain-containing protein [Bacteroidota bacterium]